MTVSLEKEIQEQLERLAPAQQHQVLAFVRSLADSPEQGVPGKNLAQFAGAIDDQDLEAISRAIEAGCEQVNLNEW